MEHLSATIAFQFFGTKTRPTLFMFAPLTLWNTATLALKAVFSEVTEDPSPDV